MIFFSKCFYFERVVEETDYWRDSHLWTVWCSAYSLALSGLLSIFNAKSISKPFVIRLKIHILRTITDHGENSEEHRMYFILQV